ncbi:MAG TPA: hypothetical protein O0X51_05850 [Methanocorpusculum sp.]|nr:hypothetical protein [Methanocorpusculum sp.]HJK72934.1 hypothetical protein [Methanocorpusculum sp.]HJK83137.1 hypothetical protein [Methanocorpusculum sp.]
MNFFAVINGNYCAGKRNYLNIRGTGAAGGLFCGHKSARSKKGNACYQ